MDFTKGGKSEIQILFLACSPLRWIAEPVVYSEASIQGIQNTDRYISLLSFEKNVKVEIYFDKARFFSNPYIFFTVYLIRNNKVIKRTS